MRNRRDQFNKALKDLTYNARTDRDILTNLIVSRGWMSQNQLAKYLGVDPALITHRLNTYKKENS